MITFPNCKINIGLWVKAKRPDGYHELETFMMPVPLCDVLEIHRADYFLFQTYGVKLDTKEGQNLCEKAWQLMHKQYGIEPVRIDLIKNIPSGAGLGGGSSDAAYTLMMLNELFDVGLNKVDLQSLAAELGADCAFFVQNKPSIARGKGELLSETSVSISGMYLVIIKPKESVNTSEAYALVTPQVRDIDLETMLRMPFNIWRGIIENDFEKEIFKLLPQLGNIKQMLYDQGALYAGMSGSGSAMFGLFDQPIEIRHPDMIYCGTL